MCQILKIWHILAILGQPAKLRSFDVVSYSIPTDVVGATLLFVHQKKDVGYQYNFLLPCNFNGRKE